MSPYQQKIPDGTKIPAKRTINDQNRIICWSYGINEDKKYFYF